MTPLTETELDALIQAEAKATKGPWAIVEDAANGKDEAWCEWHKIGPLDMTGAKPDSDGQFIAALRNAAPAILAELKASREIIAKLPRTADRKPYLYGMPVWVWTYEREPRLVELRRTSATVAWFGMDGKQGWIDDADEYARQLGLSGSVWWVHGFVEGEKHEWGFYLQATFSTRELALASLPAQEAKR